MRGLPSVSLYIRRNEKPGQPYERVSTRNPQVAKGREVYCVHFYENGKRRWLTVGNDLRAAFAERGRWEQELAAEAPRAIAPTKPTPDAPKCFEELRTAFIHDRKTSRKRDGSLREADTITHYEKVTREFLDTTKVMLPAQVTRDVLKAWKDGLYDRVSHRTVCNLYISIVCFLHFCGVDHKTLLKQDERPTPVEETPECYEEDEMTKFFFAIVNERDNLAFEFLLKTGAREREMTELQWLELSLGSEPTVQFGSKVFKTKTRKTRTVPLERGLALKLAAWRLKNPTTKYVFGTDDKVEGHFLRICKKITKRAGMEETNFWLHKFRDTAATWWLRKGVDLRTVSHWLGHSDISMTQRYLSPEKGERAQSAMNKVYASGGLSSGANT
jgi:integrase